MKTKTLIAIVAGILIGGIFILLFETLSHTIFPATVAYTNSNREAYMTSVPFLGKIMVLISWFFGALTGSITTTLIDGRTSKLPALLVNIVLQIFAIFTMFMFPHPTWMWVGSFILFIPVSLIVYSKLKREVPNEKGAIELDLHSKKESNK